MSPEQATGCSRSPMGRTIPFCIFLGPQSFFSARSSVAMYRYATSVRALPNVFYYAWVADHVNRQLAIKQYPVHWHPAFLFVSDVRHVREGEIILTFVVRVRPFADEIFGDPYRRQVPISRISNNQAQYSKRDSDQPYVQTLGTYSQTKLGQRKPKQPFIQHQRRTDVINSYPNIRT